MNEILLVRETTNKIMRVSYIQPIAAAISFFVDRQQGEAARRSRAPSGREPIRQPVRTRPSWNPQSKNASDSGGYVYFVISHGIQFLPSPVPPADAHPAADSAWMVDGARRDSSSARG
jgi:hypothetical protein